MKILFLGLIFTLLLVEGKTQNPSHHCKIFYEDEHLSVDCKEEGLLDVPGDLDPLTKFLDMSGNILTNLGQHSFDRYAGLSTLIMRAIKFSKHPDYYTFRPLKALETLDLRYVEIGGKSTIFYWPPSLKILKLTYSELKDADFLTLKHLEHLDIGQNLMYSFPLLNTLAPLKYINANLTLIRKINVEDLAPFCQLERLDTTFHPTAEITQGLRYCECERLKSWLNKYNIQIQPFECNPFRQGQKCELEFSEDVLSMRSECLTGRSESSAFLYWIIFILLIIVFAALVAAAGYLYYMRKKKETEDVVVSDIENPSDEKEEKEDTNDVDNMT